MVHLEAEEQERRQSIPAGGTGRRVLASARDGNRRVTRLPGELQALPVRRQLRARTRTSSGAAVRATGTRARPHSASALILCCDWECCTDIMFKTIQDLASVDVVHSYARREKRESLYTLKIPFCSLLVTLISPFNSTALKLPSRLRQCSS